MKIFLGDLVHDWEKVSVWTFPLNVGFIGGYANQEIDEVSEVRLFKRPDEMINAIRTEKPEVVALANYVWNSNLNAHVAGISKDVDPNILVVGGGPLFTSLNANTETASKYFKANPNYDSYIVNQGEKGFVALVRKFIECGSSVEELRRLSVPGNLINTDPRNGLVNVGVPLDALRDLDEIPSPYLSGLLDEFFDQPLSPMIETNRSCPYRCTFCAWGIGTTKLAKFGVQRVIDEIEYISSRCKKSVNLLICDANFAILERDAEIAEKVFECHEKYGFPHTVNLQWNKTRPDRTLAVARKFNGLARIGASMQSLDDNTLAAIKRKNIDLDDALEMMDALDKEVGPVERFSELIVGLPNDTWQSHLDANKTLLDAGFEVHNYNLHLLPGTEMDSEDSRNQYFKKTGWRLHDNAFGIYDGVKIFEGQEVVLETSTMSSPELASFRYIHWLIQLMWGRRYYRGFLRLLQNKDIHPVDVVVEVHKAMESDAGAIGSVCDAFTDDYALEQFSTFEELRDYWTQEEPFERLRSGEYGKLNAFYSHKILLEHPNAFADLLIEATKRIFPHLIAENPEFLGQCRDVLRFDQESLISLDEDFNLVSSKRVHFEYDILSWRDSNQINNMVSKTDELGFGYEFYIPEVQRRFLDTKLSQFKSTNLNLTWRKMTEYSDGDEFFYAVRFA